MSSTAFDPLTGLPKYQGGGPGSPGYPTAQQLGVSFGPTGTSSATTPSGSSATPTPTAGTGGFSPGRSGTGSYLGILQNDPIYQQTLSDLSAQGISDRSQADTFATRALGQFGEVPTLDGIDARLAGPDFARISGMARPLADASTKSGLSIVARMEKMRKDNIRSIKNALAARGALQSGETGFQLGEEQQRYTQAQYDARSQLVDTLSGIEAGYANAQRQLAAQRAAAVQPAVQQAVQSGYQPQPQQPPQQYQPPQQPPLVPPTVQGLPGDLNAPAYGAVPQYGVAAGTPFVQYDAPPAPPKPRRQIFS